MEGCRVKKKPLVMMSLVLLFAFSLVGCSSLNAGTMKRAGLNTILGMSIVFAVLIVISFIIYLLKYISAFFDKTEVLVEETLEETSGREQTREETPEALTVRETYSVPVSDPRLVAVITAAIAAMREPGVQNNKGSVVRSIKRRKSGNWR